MLLIVGYLLLDITKTNPKVKDHCHFTGKYRSCNLKLKVEPGKTKIPDVFHNLKGYDSHLIMQKIHTAKENITCIANNSEKYISFGIGQLKFFFRVWHLHWRNMWMPQTNPASNLQLKSLRRKQI